MMTIQRSPALQFGCRQVALMSEGSGITDAQQALLGELLQTGPQSLKSQSEKRPHANRDGITVPFHFEDLLKGPQKGNPHGWGIAAYSNTAQSLNLNRSLLKAADDPQFDAAVTQGIAQRPHTVMAHILNKVDPNRVLASPEDTHPFVFENWTGMFNGILDGGRTQAVTDAVTDTYCPILCTAPRGTNTGEKFLLTFLGKLKQQAGSVDSAQVGLDKIKQAFSQAVEGFISASKPEYRPLDGNIMGLKGQMQLAPGLNYVATDGRILLAYRRGNKLYLNRHDNGQGKWGYLVASEPMQPANKSLSWVELPQEHLLTLARQSDGSIQAALTPITLALTPPETKA